MKLKAAITSTAPSSVFAAMGSKQFAVAFLEEICADVLGAENAKLRPAEYYVQQPDKTIDAGCGIGVELRLTGVSRDGRPAKLFHRALQALHGLAAKTLWEAMMLEPGLVRAEVQLFVVIMLDGDVETSPGSGKYSNVLESEASWIKIRKDAKDSATAAASTEA